MPMFNIDVPDSEAYVLVIAPERKKRNRHWTFYLKNYKHPNDETLVINAPFLYQDWEMLDMWLRDKVELQGYSMWIAHALSGRILQLLMGLRDIKPGLLANFNSK